MSGSEFIFIYTSRLTANMLCQYDIGDINMLLIS